MNWKHVQAASHYSLSGERIYREERWYLMDGDMLRGFIQVENSVLVAYGYDFDGNGRELIGHYYGDLESTKQRIEAWWAKRAAMKVANG